MSVARRGSASALLGGVGAIARFVLDGAVAARLGRAFPFGTLAVNLSGAFAARHAGRRRAWTATRCGWPAPGCSARSRRSARGCWRATGSARTAGCASACSTSPSAWCSAWRAAWAGRRARGGAVNDDCLKLTIYFGERDRADGGFLADALADVYARHELRDEPASCAASRASAPSSTCAPTGCSRCPRTCRWSRSRSTRAPRIEAALAEVRRCRCGGLVTLERARMLTAGSTRSAARDRAATTKLTVYVGRAASASAAGPRT